MLLSYINYFAAVVGYVVIAAIFFLIIMLVVLILKDRYKNWKWDKERGKKQLNAVQISPEPNSSQPAEQPKETKETADSPNVRVSIK